MPIARRSGLFDVEEFNLIMTISRVLTKPEIERTESSALRNDLIVCGLTFWTATASPRNVTDLDASLRAIVGGVPDFFGVLSHGF